MILFCVFVWGYMSLFDWNIEGFFGLFLVVIALILREKSMRNVY